MCVCENLNSGTLDLQAVLQLFPSVMILSLDMEQHRKQWLRFLDVTNCDQVMERLTVTMCWLRFWNTRILIALENPVLIIRHTTVSRIKDYQPCWIVTTIKTVMEGSQHLYNNGLLRMHPDLTQIMSTCNICGMSGWHVVTKQSSPDDPKIMQHA